MTTGREHEVAGCHERAREPREPPRLALHDAQPIRRAVAEPETNRAHRPDEDFGIVGALRRRVAAEHRVGIVDVEVAGQRRGRREHIGMAQRDVRGAEPAHREARDDPVARRRDGGCPRPPGSRGAGGTSRRDPCRPTHPPTRCRDARVPYRSAPRARTEAYPSRTCGRARSCRPRRRSRAHSPARRAGNRRRATHSSREPPGDTPTRHGVATSLSADLTCSTETRPAPTAPAGAALPTNNVPATSAVTARCAHRRRTASTSRRMSSSPPARGASTSVRR